MLKLRIRTAHAGVPMLVALAVTLALAVSGCGRSAAVPASGVAPPAQAAPGPSAATPAGAKPAATQRSEGGQVTVEVTWKGPGAGPVFAVVMDTHAVDLDGYDLRRLAALRTDQGREVPPSGWDAPKGGHHRSGTLTFPATGPDGKPLIGPDTRSVELVIRDVAGVKERVFKWTP